MNLLCSNASYFTQPLSTTKPSKRDEEERGEGADKGERFRNKRFGISNTAERKIIIVGTKSVVGRI
jgi:hypothetical protein